MWYLNLLAACFTLVQPPRPAAPPPRELCRLSGTVYVEQVRAFATYKVYVQDLEAFADLVVFREEMEGMAVEPGHWYLTDQRAFADFTIFIEEAETFADFTVAYTPFSSAAGCRR
ncbi:MAG: hypothetical protein NW241_20575 [Bacteroidia bacterium]|nr:hypothetical protein [Bacteroidia bacterium]